jgi:transmembrane sensor
MSKASKIPNTNQPALSAELIEQAAHWHTVMQSGDVSDVDNTAFNTWHVITENADAYHRMTLMWQQLDDVDLAPARSTLQTVLTEQANKNRTPKRVINTLASVSLVAIGVSVGSQYINHNDNIVNYFRSDYLFSDYSTQIGENKTITLNDNTTIHLNTFSAINVEYTQHQRIVHLVQGEIQLNVTKDKTKSLIVETEQGTAQALGTQFVVRQRDDITDVSVTESRVEVCVTNDSNTSTKVNTINQKEQKQSITSINSCHQLTAGQQTHISNNHVLLPQAISKQFVHDWSQQLLIVDNQPVIKVLDELRRYHYGYINIDRESLKNHVVSGVFPLNDLTKSLQVLAGSLHININTYTPLLTVIKSKNR